MRARAEAPSASDIAGEMAGWMAGGGILTMMLFPLALPLILLLVVSALPLVVLALAGGLAAALVAVPVLLVRGVARWAIGAVRPVSTAEQGPTPAHEEA